MPSKLKVKGRGAAIDVVKVGGGSLATKRTSKASIDPKKVLKKLATDKSDAQFRVRVARMVQNKYFVPTMEEMYRHFITVGLPYVLRNRMRNFGDRDHSNPITQKVGGVPVVTKRITWMAHSKEYRKRLASPKSLIRNRGGDRHANRLLKELIGSSTNGKMVVGNPLKKDYKGNPNGTLDIEVSAYIKHKLKRPEYDAYVKLAFTEGTLHRSLLGGYDGIKDIGILNAFELGYGGHKGRFSRRRQRPIVGELARAYGKATGEVYRAKLKALR